MKVIDQLNHFKKPNFAAVTIGMFDGVHIGHQTILKKLVEEAKKNNGKSVLITFWPHPQFILNKKSDKLKLLSAFDEKVKRVGDLGIDYILKIAFNPEFSTLTAADFVQQILVDKVGTKHLFIGYDHHFGNNREGNIQYLQKNAAKYNFIINEISKQEIDHIGISSTKIRKALEGGDIYLANSLLGRNYSICGQVVHGDKRGKSLGFPTANIEISEDYKLLPTDGAYAIKAFVGGMEYLGMLNIGFKPTIDGRERTIEAHLFSFDADIYGHEIIIEFVEALRKEMKFDHVQALIEQLIKDKQTALSLLT